MIDADTLIKSCRVIDFAEIVSRNPGCASQEHCGCIAGKPTGDLLPEQIYHLLGNMSKIVKMIQCNSL